MKFVSLFAGIGGIDLGLERAGMTCVGQVEIDDYCTKVLRKHWPSIPKHGDVRTFEGHEFGSFDLLTGGYPCQPFSVAGQRKGEDDERHLWPEVYRIIRNVRPRLILLENVPGHLTLGFGQVLGDLAESGYDAEWDCIPAAAVGAPHLRDRVFILAYPNGDTVRQPEKPERWGCPSNEPQSNGPHGHVADAARGLLHGARASRALRRAKSANGRQWGAEPNVGRVADGVPGRVDRLRGLGNAVVPQVAEFIGRQIMAAELELQRAA